MGECDDRPEYEVAADWWAGQLAGVPRFDNGDDSQAGGMAAMMATMLAVHNRPTSGQVDAFRAALVDALRAEEARSAGLGYGWDAGLGWQTIRITLGVDYGPDGLLSGALEAAGVDPGLASLPWKTVMWIEPGKVEVRAGYGGEIRGIFPASA